MHLCICDPGTSVLFLPKELTVTGFIIANNETHGTVTLNVCRITIAEKCRQYSQQSKVWVALPEKMNTSAYLRLSHIENDTDLRT